MLVEKLTIGEVEDRNCYCFLGILRNIIEDALEEYDDLSVNDRVGILLEMIEKIIK